MESSDRLPVDHASVKRIKDGASRMQLLLAASADDGPWCAVRGVKAIQVAGAQDTTVIEILVRDQTRVSEPISYNIKGSGYKAVNIPRGDVKVRRVKGRDVITVYAHGG